MADAPLATGTPPAQVTMEQLVQLLRSQQIAAPSAAPAPLPPLAASPFGQPAAASAGGLIADFLVPITLEKNGYEIRIYARLAANVGPNELIQAVEALANAGYTIAAFQKKNGNGPFGGGGGGGNYNGGGFRGNNGGGWRR